MPVYLAALATAAVYLSQIPVRVCASLVLGAENRILVRIEFFRGARLWEKRIELDGDGLRSVFQKRVGHRPRWRGMVHYFVRHARADRAWLRMTLGLNDAAQTALLCGAAQAAAMIVKNRYIKSLNVHIAPVFGDGAFELRAGGILSVPFGHIISAMAILGRDEMIKRREKHGRTSD